MPKQTNMNFCMMRYTYKIGNTKMHSTVINHLAYFIIIYYKFRTIRSLLVDKRWAMCCFTFMLCVLPKQWHTTWREMVRIRGSVTWSHCSCVSVQYHWYHWVWSCIVFTMTIVLTSWMCCSTTMMMSRWAYKIEQKCYNSCSVYLLYFRHFAHTFDVFVLLLNVLLR